MIHELRSYYCIDRHELVKQPPNQHDTLELVTYIFLVFVIDENYRQFFVSKQTKEKKKKMARAIEKKKKKKKKRQQNGDEIKWMKCIAGKWNRRNINELQQGIKIFMRVCMFGWQRLSNLAAFLRLFFFISFECNACNASWTQQTMQFKRANVYCMQFAFRIWAIGNIHKIQMLNLLTCSSRFFRLFHTRDLCQLDNDACMLSLWLVRIQLDLPVNGKRKMAFR